MTTFLDLARAIVADSRLLGAETSLMETGYAISAFAHRAGVPVEKCLPECEVPDLLAEKIRNTWAEVIAELLIDDVGL